MRSRHFHLLTLCGLWLAAASFHQFAPMGIHAGHCQVSKRGGPLPMSRSPTRASEEPRLLGAGETQQGWSIF